MKKIYSFSGDIREMLVELQDALQFKESLAKLQELIDEPWPILDGGKHD